jgi:hypothetical protein
MRRDGVEASDRVIAASAAGAGVRLRASPWIGTPGRSRGLERVFMDHPVGSQSVRS